MTFLSKLALWDENNDMFYTLQERQERLKSLQVQFSAKSNMTSSTGCNGNLSEDASTEVLGDATTGYIVNVVREKGEEAIRILPSISAKLKVHQVPNFPFLLLFSIIWFEFSFCMEKVSLLLCGRFSKLRITLPSLSLILGTCLLRP